MTWRATISPSGRSIPNIPAAPVTLQQAIDREPRLQALRDDDEAVARLLEIALQIEGLYRHASTHAAGVVIGDRPLAELVPLGEEAIDWLKRYLDTARVQPDPLARSCS